MTNRSHYLFTGRVSGHPYSLTIKPGETHSGYEAELTTAYPSDRTISGQWLRTYLPDRDTGELPSASAIRRNLLQHVNV